jgi:hypothetical protein
MLLSEYSVLFVEPCGCDFALFSYLGSANIGCRFHEGKYEIRPTCTKEIYCHFPHWIERKKKALLFPGGKPTRALPEEGTELERTWENEKLNWMQGKVVTHYFDWKLERLMTYLLLSGSDLSALRFGRPVILLTQKPRSICSRQRRVRYLEPISRWNSGESIFGPAIAWLSDADPDNSSLLAIMDQVRVPPRKLLIHKISKNAMTREYPFQRISPYMKSR